MTCSSVPLTIESVGGFDGMQVLGIPTIYPNPQFLQHYHQHMHYVSKQN
eukprot:UN00889